MSQSERTDWLLVDQATDVLGVSPDALKASALNNGIRIYEPQITNAPPKPGDKISEAIDLQDLPKIRAALARAGFDLKAPGYYDRLVQKRIDDAAAEKHREMLKSFMSVDELSLDLRIPARRLEEAAKAGMFDLKSFEVSGKPKLFLSRDDYFKARTALNRAGLLSPQSNAPVKIPGIYGI